MTEKKYQIVLDNVINKITNGMSLMTMKEEYIYYKRIAKDLTDFAEDFGKRYLKRGNNGKT